MKRVATIAKWLGIAAIVLAIVAVGLVASALLYLQTGPGRARLRSEALSTVNGLFLGRMDAGTVEVNPGGHLLLRGVRLEDPEGRLVARIGELRAEVELPALLRRQVLVKSLAVRDAELLLADSPQGLNIARAFALRDPGPDEPAAPDGGRFGWDIVLERGLFSGLHFAWRNAPDAAPAAEVKEVTLSVSGRYRHAELIGEVGARGGLLAPLAVPFTLAGEVKGGSEGAPWDPLGFERVVVVAGGSRLQVDGSLRGSSLALQIREALLARGELRALAGDAPFAGDLRATGSARLDGSRASAELVLPDGAGAIGVSARAGLSPLDARATLRLAQVDLSRLLEGAPASELNGSLALGWRQAAEESGAGEVEIDLGRSTLLGAALDSVRARAQVEGTRVRVQSAQVAVAGGRLEASGTVDPRGPDLHAVAEIGDLKALAAVLARLGGAEPPPVAGGGRLEAALSGPWSRLRVDVAGSLARLEGGSFELNGLTLAGRLPDLSRPFVFAGDVQARDGKAGELPFSELRGKVEANRRDFSAELTTKGLAGLTARLAGAIDPGGQGARLDRISIATGEVGWRLAAPARVDLRDGFRVDRLALDSGGQHLELRGGLARGRLEASLQARGLDLAALPKVVVPASLKLAGKVDLEASAGGSTSAPRLEAELRGEGLGVLELRGASLEARARLSEKGRISGSALLRRKEAQLDASFDLPLQLLEARAGTPLSASLRVAELPMGLVGRLASLEELKGGSLFAQLELSGSSDAPRATLVSAVKGGRWGELPAAELKLDLKAAESLEARLEAAMAAGRATLDLKAGATLRALALGGLSSGELSRLPAELKLDLQGFPLEALPASLVGGEARGRLSASAQLSGSLGAPRGELKLGLAEGGWDGWNDLGLQGRVALDAAAVTLEADLLSGAQRLAKLTGKVRSAPEALRPPGALGAAPLEAQLAIGPAELPTLLGGNREALAGRLEAKAQLSGTLDRPALEADGRLAELKVEGRPMGELSLRLSHAADRTQVTAALEAARGGRATLSGSLQGALGLARLREDFDAMAMPLAASLRVEKLELALLEGFVPDLRQVGGVLGARVALRGTLGAPVAEGEASLRGGAFTLLGYGSFRELDADVQLAERAIALSKLSVRSGKGSLALSGRAERPRAGAPWLLDARLRLDAFPLRLNDRKVATLTGATERWSGQIEGMKMAFDLRLAKLVAELPELGGKDLQPLDPHPDIQIVTGEERPDSGEGGPALDLKLHVQAPRNLWVESSDVKIEAGADLTLTMAEGEVAMSGAVSTRSGRAEVLGRRFELARGNISWANDPPGNPKLDVAATHENEREKIEVTVAVTGDAEKPRIELSSEPPLGQQEIAILLATGRRELKRGAGSVAAAGGAASVVGSFFADRLRKTIATKLPLDVFQVEFGDDPLQSEQFQAAFKAGTYLTDDIYVGYRGDLGATEKENANEVQVEYQISPRVNVESKYGSKKSGVDVIFSTDY